MLADDWWFWALTGLVLAAAVVASGRYRRLAASARRRAVERSVVEPGTGRSIDTSPGGFWSDLSWLSILLGLWVAGSPWIWGYDDVEGAVTTDLVTGLLVAAIAAVGIVLPALNSLNVLGGTWLVVAPWLVGYGSEGGPVGLSDTLAGVAIAALGIAALTSASRRVVTGSPMPIGRIRPPAGPGDGH
jgi:hypothetical protein